MVHLQKHFIVWGVPASSLSLSAKGSLTWKTLKTPGIEVICGGRISFVFVLNNCIFRQWWKVTWVWWTQVLYLIYWYIDMFYFTGVFPIFSSFTSTPLHLRGKYCTFYNYNCLKTLVTSYFVDFDYHYKTHIKHFSPTYVSTLLYWYLYFSEKWTFSIAAVMWN